MIPTIDQILAEVKAGTLEIGQASRWMNQHMESFASEMGMWNLRDHFAGIILGRMLAKHQTTPYSPDTRDALATECYYMADGMIKMRSK